jgi:hypothetical protein
LNLINIYFLKLKRLAGNESNSTAKNQMIFGNKDVWNKNILLNRDEIGCLIVYSEVKTN